MKKHIQQHLSTLSERLRLSAMNYLPGRKAYMAELNEAADIVDKYTEQIETLRYIATYGSSVPLGMPPEDYYRGALYDCIRKAAITLELSEQDKDITEEL